MKVPPAYGSVKEWRESTWLSQNLPRQLRESTFGLQIAGAFCGTHSRSRPAQWIPAERKPSALPTEFPHKPFGTSGNLAGAVRRAAFRRPSIPGDDMRKDAG